MNLPNSSIYTALYARLVLDNAGTSNLTGLLGHSAYDRRIGRESPEQQAKDPYLSFRIVSAAPEAARGLSRVLIRISAHSRSEELSIQIADRVQWLLQVPSGDNRAFFDFSDSSITVKSSCWKSRVTSTYDKRTKFWTDSNLLESVIDTQNPCGS